MFEQFSQGVAFGCFVGPSGGGLGASCRRAWSCLDPCFAILSNLGGHLGLSEEILLEQSWAFLGSLTSRAPPLLPSPPSKPKGMGVGGGVKPPRRGRRGLERIVWDLNRSRPKGLVGCRKTFRHFRVSRYGYVYSRSGARNAPRRGSLPHCTVMFKSRPESGFENTRSENRLQTRVCYS